MMSSANDDDPPAPPGFSRLFSFNVIDMRVGYSKAIVLPTKLAERLNEARLCLHINASDPQAWERACVYPSRADDFQDGKTPAGKSNDPSVKAVTRAPAMLDAANLNLTPVERRKIPGRRVRVVDNKQLAERRTEIELRSKWTSTDKKIELALLDHLQARGETRVVGLRSNWRDRISELRAVMLHMGEVIDRIEACCALSAFTRQPLRIPPLLLVGPPGVGKTYLARKLANMLGVPEFVWQLESAETASILTGSDKHWANAEVGQLFKLIVQSGVHANPVIVLDELDKAPQGGNHYRPANTLHAVLDPVTSRQIRDKCIDLVFDASYAVYVATANDLRQIGAPLISRFEVFHIKEPDPEAAMQLARSIAKQVFDELKLNSRFEALDDDVIQYLAAMKSPRRMQKMLAGALGRAVLVGRKRLKLDDLGLRREGRVDPGCGSDQALRLMSVMREAIEVLGSYAAAEMWLMEPALGLDGRRPFDLLQTAEGTTIVSQLLIRIDYGVYS